MLTGNLRSSGPTTMATASSSVPRWMTGPAGIVRSARCWVRSRGRRAERGHPRLRAACLRLHPHRLPRRRGAAHRADADFGEPGVPARDVRHHRAQSPEPAAARDTRLVSVAGVCRRQRRAIRTADRCCGCTSLPIVIAGALGSRHLGEIPPYFFMSDPLAVRRRGLLHPRSPESSRCSWWCLRCWSGRRCRMRAIRSGFSSPSWSRSG